MNELAKNIFVETNYIGVNVGAILTYKGPIAIDVPTFPRDARDWAMRLHRLNQYPLQFVVLTDYNGDRTLNTRWLSAPTITHQQTAVRLNSYDKRYPLAFSESLNARYPDRGREFNSTPVERPAISFGEKLALFKGNREICLIAASGPTTGNIWVYVPDTAVLFTGDTLVVDTHPLLSDGSCSQWLQSLDLLAHWPDPIEAIVPGRGPICDQRAIQPIYTFLQQMQERARQHWQNQLPREELAQYIPEFIDQFPLGLLPADWVKRQIKQSLERVYDEIKLGYADPALSDS